MKQITLTFGESITVTLPDRTSAINQMRAEGIDEGAIFAWVRERESCDRIENFMEAHNSAAHRLLAPVTTLIGVHFRCSCGEEILSAPVIS